MIRVILADLLLTKASDPRLSFVTVTSVQISPELDTAKVFVSVLGDDEKRADVMQALRKAAPFLRTELAREVRIRRTPELRFIFDESIEHGLQMERVLKEIADERAGREGSDAAAADREADDA
jgi:ribosome-binding factor A